MNQYVSGSLKACCLSVWDERCSFSPSWMMERL